MTGPGRAASGRATGGADGAGGADGRPSGARVVGVLGARGGAGASTFACVLARRIARSRPTVLVDLDAAARGLDVLLGLEDAAGVRWPDLSDARGDVPGADLVRLLPRAGRLAVLSADRTRPRPPPDVLDGVLDALESVSDVVVLDLDRGRVVARGSEVTRCHEVVLVLPRDVGAVAGARALLPGLAGAGAVRLVVGGASSGGLGRAEVAEAVGLPVAACLRPDRVAAAAVERGAGPTRRGGPLARAAAEVARAVDASVGVASARWGG